MPTDPTRTQTLRAQYASAMRRRWRDVEALLVGALTGADAPNEVEAGAERARILLAPLMAELILETILPGGIPRGTGRGTQWQDPFVRRSYRSGAARARLFVQSLFGGATPFSLQAPLHALRIEQVFRRNFDLLRGITEAQAEVLRATLVQSLQEGIGAEEIAGRIRRSVRVIGQNRSEILARTEIVRAHAEGTLNEYERQGVTFVTPQVEFTTAGDTRVCVICLGFASTDVHGFGPGVFPVAQAHGIITDRTHPRCRCAWLPAGVGESPDARLVRAATERRRIEELRTSPEARRRQREAQKRANRRTRPVEVLT